MKKILLLLAIILPFLLTGCSGENSPIEELPTPPIDPKEYIVSLGFSGEITNIEESPLSRAVGNDLYGIQVYSMPVSSTDKSNYKPYAYGQFDDKSKMTIKLLGGYKYKFESTMVVDGKTKMKYGFFIYGKGGKWGETTNLFVTTVSEWMSGIGLSDIHIKTEEEKMYRPSVDRYYGDAFDYVPSDNGSVSIKMNRVVFGARFISEGLTDGSLSISIEKTSGLSIAYPETESQGIFSLYSGGYYDIKWNKDDYSEIIPISISWTKADGAVIPLINQDITFKRNKLTTITVKVKDNSINNSVDVSNESTPMGDGGNITIDAGNGTDTGVTPTP